MTAGPPPLELRALDPALADGLGELFEALADDEKFFHPHPLTREYARSLCAGERPGSYFAMISHGAVIGYGMLFEVEDSRFDSLQLGIAIHPGHRGLGLGRLMMLFLHAAAAAAGADSIGLHVYKANTGAHGLYASLGYTFVELGDDGLIGTLALR
jgi:ribosomal protein S18 acetylase RimI-like enzyme